jgi:hypothetical protein
MNKEEFYEKLSTESGFGINILDTDCPYLDVPWHFHPETEIIYIEKGSGTRFVGDHSEAFEKGDIGLGRAKFTARLEKRCYLQGKYSRTYCTCSGGSFS